MEVLARGEALVRGEHGPLLHGHPAGHADQARLKVCGSQRARRGEKRAGDVTKRTVTGEGGWWRERWRQEGGKEMECMLFPGSIINTVINERGDRGAAAF